MAMKQDGAAATRARALRSLRELVAALDRRVPHVERVGEVKIAREAASLRKEALKRIADLEKDD
jgi:chorismate mutase